MIAGDGDAEFDGVAVEGGDPFANGCGGGEHLLGQFANRDVAEGDGVVAQRFEFAQGFDAQHAIGGQTQFTR